jgi:peptidoglycan/LPS O-acetylase OafA/YrhL
MALSNRADIPAHAVQEVPGSGAVRLDSLTGLRWVAAFGVFLSHINVLLPIPHTGGVFALGVSGVTFFFVLSGFVLVWTSTPADSRSWFYARRFARIWPTLALAVVIPLIFAVTSGDPEIDRGQVTLIAISSLVLVQAWIPGWILTASNPVTWTLSCEAFFYAVLPFLIGPLRRRTLRQLLLLAIGLVLVGWLIRIGVWLRYPPDPNISADDITHSGGLIFGTYSPISRLNEFLLGAVGATALKLGWRPRLSVRGSTVLLFVGFLVLWLFRDQTWRSEIPYDALGQVTAPLYALLICSYAVRDVAGGWSVFATRPLQVLGQWSYAFYLFHFTVLVAVATAVYPDKTVVDFFVHPVTPEWSHIVQAAITLLVAAGLAGLIYRFYESRLERRLRRSFRRRLIDRTSTEPARQQT